MGKSLVIVESPAKARTINKYLGKDFVVKSSVGHVRDLPVSGNGKKADPKARAKAAAYTRKLPPAKRAKLQAGVNGRLRVVLRRPVLDVRLVDHEVAVFAEHDLRDPGNVELVH